MLGNGDEKRKRSGKSTSQPHDEFLELCAISTTGELSDEDEKRLREHLDACSECRQALHEFEAAAQIGVPLLAEELAPRSPAEVSSLAEVRNPQPADQAGTLTTDLDPNKKQKGFLLAHRGNGHFGSYLDWHHLWMPFAAALTLIVALGIYSYQTGQHHGIEVAQAKLSATNSQAEVNALERRLSDTGHQREVLHSQLAERDRIIRDLRRRVAVESAELTGVRNGEAALEQSLQANQAEKQQVSQEQSALNRKLDAAEGLLRKTQGELDLLREARLHDQALAESLTAQIKDLYGQLSGREETINKQQDLLEDDRDIRDLMGARNLYIAEVYDVARDGSTRKPYGRIFYTKGKSLIFYAYDLEQQPGVRKASTFQAWGQSGPDRDRALSLGIFYQDNAAKKRWVLKFDNSHTLDEINAVFVTVEPHGGSNQPSGKRLLFASLRIEPNHP
jgi:anti-sigma factor RsiW